MGVDFQFLKNTVDQEFYANSGTYIAYRNGLRTAHTLAVGLSEQLTTMRSKIAAAAQGQTADALNQDLTAQLQQLNDVAAYFEAHKPDQFIDQLYNTLLSAQIELENLSRSAAPAILGWQIPGTTGLTPQQTSDLAAPIVDDLNRAYQAAATSLAPMAQLVQH